jgi:Ca-activated chloride channel family protein
LRLRWVPHAFRALALLAIGLGALGLHVEQLQPAGTMRGLNIVLVIDASRSMLAQDFEPNRLGSATRLTEEFVKRRPGDRFGLVTFAGDVILECPITVDRGALVATIRDVSTLNRSDGTALGEAIASGVARLKTTPANGRVILILSDGAGNTGRMTSEEAATLAAAQNVRVYAVGIGATGPVPYPTEFGMLSVVLDLDDAVLRQVTATTGGEYFRAADSRTLEMAFDKLDRLEPAEFVLPARRRQLPLTPAFALLALAALLVEEILAASVFRSLTR